MSFRINCIDPSILVSRRGGEERAAGVHFLCMTAASDDANKAENQKTKGIMVFQNGKQSIATKI